MNTLLSIINYLGIYVFKTTLLVSIVMALLIFVRTAYKKHVVYQLTKYIWIIILLKIILPFDINLPFNMSGILKDQSTFKSLSVKNKSTEINKAEKAKNNETGAEKLKNRSGRSKMDVNNILSDLIKSVNKKKDIIIPSLVILWFSGVIISILIILLKILLFARIMKKERQSTDEKILTIVENCKKSINNNTPLAVVVSDKVTSPVLFGFIRPRVLLPKKLMEKMGDNELKHIILHELFHLKNNDIIINWLTSICSILHWFNPIVQFGINKYKEDREIACDNYVLNHLSQENISYGNTLLKVLDYNITLKIIPSQVGIIENKLQLKTRLNQIKHFKNRKSKLLFSTSIIIALITAFFIIPGSSAKSDKKPYSDDIVAILIDDESIDYLGGGIPSRDNYADIINKLYSSYNPKVVYLDVFICDKKDIKTDQLLIDSVKGKKNLIFGSALCKTKRNINIIYDKFTLNVNHFRAKRFNSRNALLPIKEFIENGVYMGFAHVDLDKKGMPTKFPPFCKLRGKYYANITIIAYLLYRDLSLSNVKDTEKSIVINNMEIPVTRKNGSIEIKYNKRIRYFSPKELLTKNIDKKYFNNKIILIGAAATGLGMWYNIPGKNMYPSTLIVGNSIQTLIDNE